MANIDQVQLPDGSQYNIIDDTSGYATQTYVQNAIAGVNKNTIGLGNVDNTSDADKPVSTAQQTALDGKTDTSMVAEIQTTLTANKRYDIGNEFIYEGDLYKATAIIPNGDSIEIGTNASLADSITTQIGNANSAISTLNTAVAGKANKIDLTNLDLTGTTNTTGSTIAIGTYFYLNGVLVRAKTAIASGATFTLNTNYEVVTSGGLNSVADAVNGTQESFSGTTSTSGTIATNVGANKIVIGAMVENTSAVAIPRFATSSNFWTIAVYDATSNGLVPMSNTSVSGTLVYVNKKP